MADYKLTRGYIQPGPQIKFKWWQRVIGFLYRVTHRKPQVEIFIGEAALKAMARESVKGAVELLQRQQDETHRLFIDWLLGRESK